MAIDADLSAGLINDKEAQRRRRELEEESAFFGSMDGASKFVRGDAIAGLIILAVNIFGGIVIGVTRHGMPLGQAADVFAKLSVGDGLVSQIPALIVSLGAALLVSKGGTRGSAERRCSTSSSHFPRALLVAALLMFVLALVPGLPFLPFAVLGGAMVCDRHRCCRSARRQPRPRPPSRPPRQPKPRHGRGQGLGRRSSCSTAEIELVPRQAARRAGCSPTQGELGPPRRQDAPQVRPAVRLRRARNQGRRTASRLPPKAYQIKIHGTVVASQELRLGEVLVITGDGRKPTCRAIEMREPAFGMKAAVGLGGLCAGSQAPELPERSTRCRSC